MRRASRPCPYPNQQAATAALVDAVMRHKPRIKCEGDFWQLALHVVPLLSDTRWISTNGNQIAERVANYLVGLYARNPKLFERIELDGVKLWTNVQPNSHRSGRRQLRRNLVRV